MSSILPHTVQPGRLAGALAGFHPEGGTLIATTDADPATLAALLDEATDEAPTGALPIAPADRDRLAEAIVTALCARFSEGVAYASTGWEGARADADSAVAALWSTFFGVLDGPITSSTSGRKSSTVGISGGGRDRSSHGSSVPDRFVRLRGRLSSE